MLVRWSNGLLYKAYVLSMKNRECEIELDNYNTAIIDVKVRLGVPFQSLRDGDNIILICVLTH